MMTILLRDGVDFEWHGRCLDSAASIILVHFANDRCDNGTLESGRHIGRRKNLAQDDNAAPLFASPPLCRYSDWRRWRVVPAEILLAPLHAISISKLWCLFLDVHL